MKFTLLEMTQQILSRMDSDEVNSISDTTESMQVANVIRSVYFNIIARANLPELNGIYQLDASTEDTLPTIMTKPDNMVRMDCVQYFVEEDSPNADHWEDVKILSLRQFMNYVQQFNPEEANVIDIQVTPTMSYWAKNDVTPTYCTVLNDNTVLFDSYNAALDSTLQSSKVQVFAEIVPEFELADNFVPTLDDQQFPLLLNEAASTCFMDLKQTQNPAADREARRQWNTLQRTKRLPSKPTSFDRLPNFGRR